MMHVIADQSWDHALDLTEGQLAQLCRLPIGESLFECLVVDSHYGLEAEIGQPFLADGLGHHQLIIQYEGVYYGKRVMVKQGAFPWDRGQDDALQRLYGLSLTPSIKQTLGCYVYNIPQ